MRILVVEDQDSIRRMIEALVTRHGHEVVGVATGVKALEVCMQSPPDIVLLDLNLPGQFDGFEVCRRVRQAPATRGVPVVIISALDDPTSRSRASSAGAMAYYTKPFSPIGLLKEIEKLKTNRAKMTDPPPT